MSNIMAAVGRVQLARFEPEFAPARRGLADRYRENMSDIEKLSFLLTDPDDFIVPHILPVRVLHGHKKAVKNFLEREGIPTGLHYKPNHFLSYFGGGATHLPATEQIYDELVTLPLHPGLNADDVDNICDVLRRALRS
jgi:dTDP-4-amino-4,6-dideoxygalactose transaminase